MDRKLIWTEKASSDIEAIITIRAGRFGGGDAANQSSTTPDAHAGIK
jgi:plasmid stabilization system protein ParE